MTTGKSEIRRSLGPGVEKFIGACLKNQRISF
jgi:hypothetical protein